MGWAVNAVNQFDADRSQQFRALRTTGDDGTGVRLTVTATYFTLPKRVFCSIPGSSCNMRNRSTEMWDSGTWNTPGYYQTAAAATLSQVELEDLNFPHPAPSAQGMSPAS